MYAPGRGGEYAAAPSRRLLWHPAGRRLRRLSTQLTDASRQGGPLRLAHCWSPLPAPAFTTSPKAATRRLRPRRSCASLALYEIEDDIRGKTADERRAVRQGRTKALVDKLEGWLKEQLARISRGSTLAEAIRYGLNHWSGLTRFLDDGRIEWIPIPSSVQCGP